MNGNVDDMVSGDRKAVHTVVERKGEVADITFHEMTVKLKPLCIRRACKIMEVLHNGIVDKIIALIPLKRSIKGVGIYDDNEKNQAGYMKP